MSIVLGILMILHGLVHLLYAGQSLRMYQMRPGMTWPDGSWAFSKILSAQVVRWLVAILLTLAALGFVLAGIGLLLKQGWFQPITVGAAIFSSVVYLLSWDGKLKGLDEKGGLGLLLNLAFLFVAIFVKLAF